MDLLRSIARAAEHYRLRWLATVGTRNNRQRLLCDLCSCLLIIIIAMNVYRQEPSLSCSSGTAPASYPCSNPSSLHKLFWLYSHLPAISAHATATYRVILALVFRAAATALFIMVTPAFFLRHRSYIHLWGTIFSHTVMYSSLVIHQQSASSHGMESFLSNSGMGLVWQQVMCNVSCLFLL